MYQPVILYIGLRYMRRRTVNRFGRFISWFATIAITLGVMAMVAVLSVMNGFEYELERNVIRFMPQAMLTTHEGRLNPKHIPASMMSTMTGFTRITSLTTSNVMLQSARSTAIGVMLGINPEEPEPLSNYMLGTKQNNLLAGQYRVILGNTLAEILGVKHGDIVRLIIPGVSQFTPMGRILSQRLFTLVGTFAVNSEIDSYQLLVNQQDASRLMRYPIGYITGWRLWLQKPLSVERLSAQSLPDGLVWRDWRERKGELFQAICMEKNMIGLLFSLIITVAAFNIITSLGLLVMEKRAEIAILQTQGLTRRQVVLIFMTQGASSGIIGTFLGAIFGILLAKQLNFLMSIFGGLFNEGGELPVAVEPIQISIITLSAIAVALLSTIYPSWHAASVYPAEALRYE